MFIERRKLKIIAEVARVLKIASKDQHPPSVSITRKVRKNRRSTNGLFPTVQNQLKRRRSTVLAPDLFRDRKGEMWFLSFDSRAIVLSLGFFRQD